MSFILKAFSTLIGVSTVMLTCSLVVMSMVRVLQYLANSRGQTLGEMLGSLNQGFRTDGRDIAGSDDAARLAFIQDVLTYPTLQGSDRVAKMTAPNLRPDQLLKRRGEAVRAVEYLAKKDLLAIVRSMLEPMMVPAPHVPRPPGDTDPDDARLLPARWSVQLPPEKRTFYAFRRYVEHWYETLEGVATEQFKTKARRMTASLSCVLVVFLNLDGLQLAVDIFESPDAQQLLESRAPVILKRAESLGATTPQAPPSADRDELIAGAGETFVQMNGVLNEPSLRLGWQESKITKAWCACAEQAGPCPGIVLGTVRWFAGLLFSCLLLALGAPFWADMLKNLLNFRNAVKAAVAPATSQPTD